MESLTLTAKALYKNLSFVVLSLGLIIFVVGAIDRFQRPAAQKIYTAANLSPELTERKLAIEDAQKQGKKTYTYTSNFIPGIGKIADPGQYKQNWVQQQQQASPNLSQVF